MTVLAILKLVSLLTWAFYIGQRMLKTIHMLQLNSYRNTRLWTWYTRNFMRTVHVLHVLPVVAIVLLFSDYERLAYACWIAAFLLLAITFPKEVEKKKLVYTPRVIRLIVTTSIVLIVGVALLATTSLIALTVLFLVALLPTFVLFLTNTINRPIELAINRYYVNDAKRKIKQHTQLQVIGITGSFGKTSVKHFLSTLISNSFHTLMTPGSFNTPNGVTMTIRANLQPVHEVFICEMGAKQRGDIREICDIVHPKYGIITSIGEQHLETFKSLDTIKATKFELVESLPADGVAFLNMDDENIASQLEKSKLQCKVVTFGSSNADVDYFAADLRYSPNGCTFTVKCRDGEQQEFETVLLGDHNIQNLIACIAVGHTLGISLEKLSAVTRKVRPVKHRLELKRSGKITIMDDSFNSNPVGSKAALDVLAQMPGHKVLITPGMIELGEKEYTYNYAFAEAAAKVCDTIILVGPKQTKPMQDALQAVGYSPYYVAKHLQEALTQMHTITAEDMVVLLENDLPDNYNE